MKKIYTKPASEIIPMYMESPILRGSGEGEDPKLPTGEEKVEQGSNEMNGGWSSSEWTDE